MSYHVATNTPSKACKDQLQFLHPMAFRSHRPGSVWKPRSSTEWSMKVKHTIRSNCWYQETVQKKQIGEEICHDGSRVDVFVHPLSLEIFELYMERVRFYHTFFGSSTLHMEKIWPSHRYLLRYQSFSTRKPSNLSEFLSQVYKRKGGPQAETSPFFHRFQHDILMKSHWNRGKFLTQAALCAFHIVPWFTSWKFPEGWGFGKKSFGNTYISHAW